jgi:hypothetical protein
MDYGIQAMVIGAPLLIFTKIELFNGVHIHPQENRRHAILTFQLVQRRFHRLMPKLKLQV